MNAWWREKGAPVVFTFAGGLFMAHGVWLLLSGDGHAAVYLLVAGLALDRGGVPWQR